jgi:excisionase family DNA binding protein
MTRKKHKTVKATGADDGEITSIEDAAKRLGIGRNQAYEAARHGQLPVIRIGRRYLVPTAALNRLLSGSATA